MTVHHLTNNLAAWLEETARRTGPSRGQIVRTQLEWARSGQADQPFMKLAGSVTGLPPELSRREGFSPS